MGIKSILLRMRIIFLSGIDNIFLSMYLHLQERGSLASRTQRIISHAQIIFFISFQYFPDSWKFLPSTRSYPSSQLYIESSYYCGFNKWSISGNFYFSKCSMVESLLAALLLRDCIILFLNCDRLGGLFKSFLFTKIRNKIHFLAFPCDFCILNYLRLLRIYKSFFWFYCFPINNQQYIYYNTTTMDNQDILLNIATPTHRNNKPTIPVQNKKKEKYSITFKKERAKSYKQRNTFDYNLLPLPGQTPPKETYKEEAKDNTQAKSEAKMENYERGENQINLKRERNTSYSRGQSANKGYKKIKRDNENLLNVENFDSSKIKISTPQQIKPEVMKDQDKIDTNSLEQFNLHRSLQDSLIKNDVTKLTQIQIECFKPIFNGKDVIAKASTGSGKTLAYLIPLINQYLEKKVITDRQCGTVMLIICPSRQLCIQGQKQVLRCLKRCPFIVPGLLIGGQQTNHQKMRLRKGVNILFSTPGRLLYHLQNTQSFKYSNLKTIIFQEADRTLDLGFQQTIHKILDIMTKKIESEYYQKILVSAHFNEKVQNLLKDLNMDNPLYIGFESENSKIKEQDNWDNQQKQVKQTKEKSAFFQQEINISKNLKQQYVLITEQQRIPFMIAYLRLIKESKVLIFVNTIDEVQYLDYLLSNMKYRDSNGNFTVQNVQMRRVFKIHGDLDQKYRSTTYFQFRKQKSAILISTQVASRGLDFPDLNHIILFDVPPTITDYGNRVGRTARYNSSGVSLMMLHYQESDYAEQIRYYSPSLELLDKDIIFGGFQNYLEKLNIRQKGLYYIEGLVRSLVKDDDQKYQLARKAYTSMLRAYAKLRDKHIFAIKKLDLKLLGRCFGINSTGGRQRTFNSKAKESHFEAQRKNRKVVSVKKLQVSEYL